MKFFAIFQSFREGGFIRSFFLAARRTNPEGLPFFINPSVTSCHLPYIFLRHTPQCFGARQGRRVRVTLRLLQCDTPHMGYGKGRSGIILNFRPALFPI